MDKKNFELMLNTYGSDLRRWPEPQRQAATLLLEAPEFADLVKQEQRFDAFLHSQPCEPPEAFLARLSKNLNENVEVELSHLWSPVAPKLAALSFAFVLGFLVSFLDLGLQADPIYFDEIALDLSQMQGEEE